MPIENSNTDVVSESEMTECQFHNNCGGWCETRRELQHNLCEHCLEEHDEEIAQPAAEQHHGEPIRLTAVAELVDDGDGGLDPRWTLEGGTAELFAGMTLLVADNAPELCHEDGSAEVYTHPDSGKVERLRAEVKRLDLLVSQGDHDYDMYRANFDRQLAERDALLRKAWRGPRTDEDCAAIDAALSASEKPSTPASCTWTYNNNSFAWDTNCANSFTLMEDGPKENGMKFCPYCSKPILQAPHDTES